MGSELNGYEVSFQGDGKQVLEQDNGDVCTTL